MTVPPLPPPPPFPALSPFLFPDNTVLCNFAAVDRLDLLKSVLGGRGRWTEAVAHEARRSAPMLPPLSSLPLEGWLGSPIVVDDPAEIRRVARIRRLVFGGADDRPLKHLGEAQTCYVIKNWPSLAGSWWISDDRDALRYARFQGIATRETIDLMGLAVAAGEIADGQAFGLMERMAACDRHLRLPKSPGELRR